MAIDQTEKRRALARQAAQLAPSLMDVLYALDALRRKRDSGGAFIAQGFDDKFEAVRP